MMSEFESHFESVSRERYVIASVIERMKDVIMYDKTISVNEQMNEMSGWEERVKPIK